MFPIPNLNLGISGASTTQTLNANNQGAAIVVGPNAAPWPQPAPASVQVVGQSVGQGSVLSNPTPILWGMAIVGGFLVLIGLAKKIFSRG